VSENPRVIVPPQGTSRRPQPRVLIAEPLDRQALRRLVRPPWRLRLAATQQECADLAYAQAADVMIVDLDYPEFDSPEFIGRVRFVARNAFPILGISRRPSRRREAWFDQGLSDLLGRGGLSAVLLNHKMRHWVRHFRMRTRLQRADSRALEWWCSLADGLAELRTHLIEGLDGAEAYLGLLAGGEGALAERRTDLLTQADAQLAEIRRTAEQLSSAASLIRRKGIARSRRDALAGKRVLLPEGWLQHASRRPESEHWVDLPGAPSSGGSEPDLGEQEAA
jgi:hypothetical protein